MAVNFVGSAATSAGTMEASNDCRLPEGLLTTVLAILLTRMSPEVAWSASWEYRMAAVC